MQNVMQIATNAGHTAQNDGRPAQNDGRTTQNAAATHLMFAKDQRRGACGAAPLPLYLKKLLCLEMIFRT